MNGQLSMFDWHPNEERKPCHYRFKRYVGQEVQMMFGAYKWATFKTGVITYIGPYYTGVRINGRDYAGTPYNISPVEGE